MDKCISLTEIKSGQKDERSAEEVHAELETFRHQYDMNTNTNAGVVEQFRKRQAEIATLKETIEEREVRLNKVETRITRTRVSVCAFAWGVSCSLAPIGTLGAHPANSRG